MATFTDALRAAALTFVTDHPGHDDLPEVEGLEREDRRWLFQELYESGLVTAQVTPGDDRILDARNVRITPSGESALRQALHLRNAGSNGRPATSHPPEEKQRRRAAFMQKVYEMTDGSGLARVRLWEVADALGWDRTDAYPVYEYLAGEGLVEAKAMGGGGGVIAITHDGVVEVEEAMQEPTQRTEHFPANSITIGDVQGNVQIGIAGNNVSQEQTVTGDELATARDLAVGVREHLDGLGFDDDSRAIALHRVEVLELELSSQRPDRGLVRRAGHLLGEVVLGAAGSGAYVGLVALAQTAAGWV